MALILVGDLLLAVVLLYVFAGAAYALHFCTKVAGTVNVRARFSSPVFRLMLAPGAVLLWPLLWDLERRGRLGSEDRVDEPKDPAMRPGQRLPLDGSGSGASAMDGVE